MFTFLKACLLSLLLAGGASAALFGIVGDTHQSGGATVTQEDSFVDAGVPLNLNAHTPTTGAWTQTSGDATDWGISTSGALASSISFHSTTLVSAADTPTTNQVLEITWGTDTTSNALPQILMRAVDSLNGIQVLPNYGGSGTTYIVDLVAGSNSGSVTTCTLTIVTGHVYRMVLSGANFTLADNGTHQAACDFTSAHYTTGVHIGLYKATGFNSSNIITHWKSGSGF